MPHFNLNQQNPHNLTAKFLTQEAMDSNNPKRSKNREEEEDDRISSLPDDLLCGILSFLPTKEAVASSILSTRWKYVSSSIPNIDLDDLLFLYPQDSRSHISRIFVEFVYKLLLVRKSPYIHRFRLNCGSVYSNSTVYTWILAVLSHNVCEIDVLVDMQEFGTLPRETLTCKTLEVLKLGRSFVLNVPKSFVLPNLKVLHLNIIKLNEEDSIRRIFSSCPVLEDLSLCDCPLEGVEVFEVSHPLLKVLEVNSCIGDYRFVLDTPNLQILKYTDSFDRDYLIKNVKSLVSADIDWGLSDEQLDQAEAVDGTYGRQESKFVNEMHNVRYLCLSEYTLAAIHFSRCRWATFPNLTFLELGPIDWYGWPLMSGLLESSPNLEMLVFLAGFDDYSTRSLLDGVPVCFCRCLREIRIETFIGEDFEFEVVEDFLRKGEVLRKLVLGCDTFPVSELIVFDEPSQWISLISTRLLKYPRRSKTCEIVLKWDKDGESYSMILN